MFKAKQHEYYKLRLNNFSIGEKKTWLCTKLTGIRKAQRFLDGFWPVTIICSKTYLKQQTKIENLDSKILNL
jgi:hypothetical protein